MRERIFTVRNRAGIHCRPSGVILNTINQEFPDHTVEVETSEGVVEINSMLDLISMGLAKGAKAVLRIEGVDEDRAIERIGDLFEFEFDFPPK